MVPVTFKKRGEIRTEVLVEEGQRGEVAAQAEELGHHHEPVPGADGQRHHQQLGQDERREGDGHHVHELRLKQHQRAVHEDATWWRPRETKHATWTTGQKPLFFPFSFQFSTQKCFLYFKRCITGDFSIPTEPMLEFLSKNQMRKTFFSANLVREKTPGESWDFRELQENRDYRDIQASNQIYDGF